MICALKLCTAFGLSLQALEFAFVSKFIVLGLITCTSREDSSIAIVFCTEFFKCWLHMFFFRSVISGFVFRCFMNC